MIKHLFIPDSINGYFLISQRILSFTLLKDRISAAQILVAGRTRTIQAITHQPLETDSGLTYEEQVVAALKLILKRHKYHQIAVAIPSHHTIFKELTLPFVDAQKIKQVLNFEIENSLPFTIDKAIVSFLILNQNPAQRSADILAAVVQKKDLEYYYELFKQAGVKGIDRWAVELFDSYNLLRQIPAYQQISEPYALIDLRDQTTNILYVRQQQLKAARVLPKGLTQILRQFSSKTKLAYPEALELLKNSANTPTGLSETISEYLQSWLATFAAFAQTLQRQNLTLDLSQILLLETDLALPAFTQQAQQATQLPCHNLTPQLLLENRQFKSNLPSLNMADWSPLATAYSATTSDHSALEYTAASNATVLLRKQIAVGLFLSGLVLGLLSVQTYLEIQAGQTTLERAEQEALTKLRQSFNLPAKDQKNLTVALKAAAKLVTEERTIWFAFASRFSGLEYLNELSLLLDPAELGLKLKKLTITETGINLQGKVGDIKYVPTLIHALESSTLFELVKRPQATDFDIQLKLKPREEAR